MADAVLRTDALTKRFHGIVATDNVHLSVMSGELHAIIGPNGAGKTTLLAQLAGELQPDSGTIFLDERDVTRLPVYRRAAIGLGRSYQITSVFLELTVLENVAFAVQARSGHSFRFFKPTRSDTSLTQPALTVANLVGLRDRMHVVAGDLSHGEQRQLEVAMLLATNPRVLLMDEPMAGMAPEEARRLVDLIQRLKRTLTIVLIEHDMDAVFALADRITVMFYGRAIATDTVAAIRSNSEVKRVYFG